ncbi:GNAT family N-acetyltransferase [Actinomadura scrupuli]|uniref:GNAT family N-acetyltransferase n=1 Tax=Actinomadura scrupuli TaxID=559629 RepID=UPI003D9542D9
MFVVDGHICGDGQVGDGQVGDGHICGDGQVGDDQVGDGQVGDGRAGLAASGVGVIDQRLPGPRTPNGRWGHISGMVTDPGHRRQGHARAIMTELLAWFHAHEVRRIDLHASPDGEALYRALGFTEHHGTALTWTASQVPVGEPVLANEPVPPGESMPVSESVRVSE